MKTYKFKVIVTDHYITEVSVEAESLEQGAELAFQDIETCPVSTRSNTFAGMDIDIDPIPAVENAEGLLGDDPEDSPDVILVEDLSDEQRNYLGID